MSLQRKQMIVLGRCDARQNHARRICHRNAVSMRLDTVEPSVYAAERTGCGVDSVSMHLGS